MSMVTSVIVSVFAIDRATEENIIKDIQRWIAHHGHMPFERIGSGFGTGGGEKSLTCSLLIGSFNYFKTEKFRRMLGAYPLFDVPGQDVEIQLIVMEVDREDDVRWKILPLKGDEE